MGETLGDFETVRHSRSRSHWDRGAFHTNVNAPEIVEHRIVNAPHYPLTCACGETFELVWDWGMHLKETQNMTQGVTTGCL